LSHGILLCDLVSALARLSADGVLGWNQGTIGGLLLAFLLRPAREIIDTQMQGIRERNQRGHARIRGRSTLNLGEGGFADLDPIRQLRLRQTVADARNLDALANRKLHDSSFLDEL
jgi:hypothetical protein